MLLHSILLCLLFWCVHSNNFNGAIDEQAIFLDLSSSEIKILKDYFFNSTKDTYINLANNNISSISFAAFDGIPNLVYLNFSGNPAEFYIFHEYLPNLETLVLDATTPLIGTPINEEYPCDNYQLEERPPLPDSDDTTMHFISFFPKLHELYLRGKNISEVAIDECKFPNLTHLYLNQNNLQSSKLLETLPKSLTHLCLNNNNFTKIGIRKERWMYEHGKRSRIIRTEWHNFENLNNLLHLDISHNKISHFAPNSFDNLTALSTLRLDHNKFSKIPEIYGLVNLERLSLTHNQIRQLNQTNVVFPSLKKLNLSNNYIDEIDVNAFTNFPALEDLDLSGNSLKYLPKNWISKTNVKYLYLRNNYFENVADLSLSEVKSLTYLSISDNPVTRNLLEIITRYLSVSENITIHF